MERFESIAQIALRHAGRHPNRAAVIFLERGESETERLSYGELETEVERFSAGLVAAGLGGQPVMLALPAGSAFVALFLASLRVGAIAIPVPFPENDKSANRLLTILSDSRPAAIITDSVAAARLARIAPGVKTLTVDDVRADSGEWDMPPVSADQPAFIQYTSGSTQAPKGIVITHGNVLANQRMIRTAFDHDERIVGVNWLPHFHDMGLIGVILQPLFLGGTTVIMPPRAFVQKPIRWLRAIETYGATTAGGPCFGYDLCVRMISAEQAASLDLSSWRVAFCGSEPIRSATLSKFAEHFRDARFRSEAFLPCYGLAETTLITSSVPAHTGFSQREIQWNAGSASRQFVSCGSPVKGSTIVLRGESGSICRSADTVGEICVSGPHVSPGRWNGEARSVTPFPDSFSDGGVTYLPTGDIGTFIDGELFPIDRIRDTIILYGAKIHAADIEATAAEESSDIRAAAAFSIDDGKREKLMLICELDRRAFKTSDHASLSDRLSRRIAETHGVVPGVGLVVYGTLPRTSSGKIQRFASKTNFLSGQISPSNVQRDIKVMFSPPPSSPEPHAERQI